MSVRAIAVDMDGTFLDPNQHYDKARFLALYQQLKDQGIEFIVASGNQYYQLVSYFPEVANEISFVAENGALLYLHGEEIFHGEMTEEALDKVYTILDSDPSIDYVACGLNGAYMLPHISQEFADIASHHYARLEKVASIRAIDDVMFKFSIKTTVDHADTLIAELAEQLGDVVHTVSSGFGFIDLIIPGLHKANGLKKVLARFDIDPAECVAIGDSLNDKEMLELVGYSFAMGNAADKVKAVARYHTETNEQAGALNVIEKVVLGQAPFNA
ncbi:Cof-type HAD-IIB family hydrolase [Vibrio porteresiae]|uniref:Cof-type HAD-IIB family hydrolase n=1 Tax=Vibrio porteresiae DSM 19223 TaxID=1123496 RepID=A0ABZ0QHV2_9VIBR|nr:Cof-type HAD-IIB family hydrolase [Vibrio porteresiae]WPC76073.1 Cof-type HAD-IIB family hydrolase [Vibrio porteresiae DSM 19223]